MKILDRYIGKEVLMTSIFAVAVLSLVLVLGNVFKQLLDLLVNHDVPLDAILSFVGYILPFSLTFTIPWGFLTAVLLVFGKISAENELIALRSSGVSMTRLCASVGVIAVAFSMICLWINVSVAPQAQEKMKNALFNIATSNPLAMFGSDQVIEEFPGKKIYVERKEGRSLFNILVYNLGDNGEPITVMHAREGELETDLVNKQVLMHLKDARYEQRDESSPNDFSKIRQGITMREGTFPISLQELYEKNRKRRGLSQWTLEELMKADNQKQLTTEQLTAAKTEVNKRFSFSFASIAFALVGIPLAITAHRKETSVGFLFSLVVAFVYFFFIILADNVQDNPKYFPHLLIWLPNVIFMGLGTWLFSRLARQ